MHELLYVCICSGGAVLKVFGTQLKSLDLNSLKTIGGGDIIIGKNDKLCFVSTINWGLLRSTPNSGKLHIGLNRNQSLCGVYPSMNIHLLSKE